MTNVTIANSFMKITIYDRYSRMSVAERDAAFAEFPTLKKDYHDAIVICWKQEVKSRNGLIRNSEH